MPLSGLLSSGLLSGLLSGVLVSGLLSSGLLSTGLLSSVLEELSLELDELEELSSVLEELLSVELEELSEALEELLSVELEDELVDELSVVLEEEFSLFELHAVSIAARSTAVRIAEIFFIVFSPLIDVILLFFTHFPLVFALVKRKLKNAGLISRLHFERKLRALVVQRNIPYKRCVAE